MYKLFNLCNTYRSDVQWIADRRMPARTGPTYPNKTIHSKRSDHTVIIYREMWHGPRVNLGLPHTYLEHLTIFFVFDDFSEKESGH